MQLVANAAGCFWILTRRKLAFVRVGIQKQPVGPKARQLHTILCKAPAASGKG